MDRSYCQNSPPVVPARAQNQDKIDFFRQLDAIEDGSDSDFNDEGFVVSGRFFTRTTQGGRSPSFEGSSLTQVARSSALGAKWAMSGPTNEAQVPTKPQLSSRSSSVPDLLQRTTPEGSAVRVAETPLNRHKATKAGHLRCLTLASPSMSKSFDMAYAAIPRVGGKRKRELPIERVPEARQIFKNQVFYFFPNNDTNASRRMRIAKALQFGATWTWDWCNGITHVIVDDNINYQDLLKSLKVKSLPNTVILVNEKYTADCISYRALLNHQQKHYEIVGAPLGTLHILQKPADKASLPAVSSSRRANLVNLPLKPAGPSMKLREPETSQSSGGSKDEPRRVADATSKPIQAPPEQILISDMPYYKDALSSAIAEAKSMQTLALLDLEDDAMEGGDSHAPSEEDESQTEERPSSSTRERKNQQVNFQCMEKHDGTSESDNPNSRIIEVLEQMAEYYDRTNDRWRTIAYRKAIATLRKQSKRIMFKEEAARLPFVGERLAAKIEEIAWTDRLKRLDNALDDSTDKTLSEFMQIYDVGLTQAHHWAKAGYRTLQDLLKYAKLSDNQRIGIVHFDDFQARIPRREVERHGAVVRNALEELDPEFEVHVMGSYRRGASDTGDIDLIITRPGADMTYIRHTVIDELVPKLNAQGFLKAALARTHRETGTKWHGCSALPENPTWRRIDLLLVPWAEMGAALIYFTGNDIFNRSIRLLASRKVMRLNQRGLYKVVMSGRNRGRERVTDGELLEGRSEERIFEILGVPWRPPEHRIC